MSLFHDKARIYVEAGKGGDGGLSFRREKHVPRGGPDGGDGGPGGSVVLVADSDLRDLSRFRPGQRLRARRGEPGRGANRHGAAGSDLELRVPVGTQVLDEDGELIADLVTPGARAEVARGGDSGRGNKIFATPARQTPRFAEIGLPGEEAWLTLQLKLLADAALVGLPNAGKSSLLSRLSNARPKVASYPFTTLAPVLGTIDSPDGSQLTIADVPGLIEGASEGVGLGHEFLAHLERARMLLHVIDASADDVALRYAQIERELQLYGAGLDRLPEIVVLNKIDLLTEPPSFVPAGDRLVRTFGTSCATGAGVSELQRALFELCAPPPEPAEEEDGLADFLVYRPRPERRRPFRIFRTDRGLRVVGDAPSGVELEAVLRSAGARRGDEVELGNEVLEWE